MKTFRMLFFLALLLSYFIGNAQQRQVSGTVSDLETNEGLPGVNVIVKGTSVGTVTNVDGTYTIDVSSNEDILVFSSVGFTPEEIIVGNQSVLDVAMAPDIKALEEIVVIGYGTVKKSDLTGSVASLRGEALTAPSNANPTMALQGAVSGVQVMESGAPGTSPTVKIRGIGTTGNSNPLYVVDGMFMDDVQYLNNNDIESIEVLKDASATAIYGSRGANGVIMITTKSGKSAKPSFNFTFYEGYQNPLPFNLVSAQEYGQLINEGNIGQGGQAAYDPDTLGAGTDWFNEVAKGGPIRDYQLSFSQQTKNANFYVSVGYHGNKGIIDYGAYERITVRLNNTYKLSKNVSLGHNVSFVRSNKENINMDNVWGWLYRVKPTIAPYDENGEFNDVEVGSNGNVVARIHYTNNETELLGAIGNAFMDINFLKDFTFKSNFGFNLQNTQNYNFNPTYQVGTGNQRNLVSSLSKEWSSRKNWLWENTVTYDKTFNVHHVNILAGYTAQENFFEKLNGNRSDLFAEDESLWYLDAGNTEGQQNGNIGTSNAYTSWLFRANYGFDSRYILTATLRADASSRFPKDDRVGYFPSIAAAWNVSNESFMSDASFVSNLKVRGSWGQIGNDKIGDYRYFALATISLNDYAIFNNAIQRGSTVQGLVNQSVTWETAESMNIGFELGLLDDRFGMELDYYKRTTNDMLVNVGVPGTVGLSATEGNVGSVENKGFDLSMSWKEKKGDFNYGIAITGTSINNEVVDLGTEEQIIKGWRQSNWTTVGESIGYFYGYEADGIFQNQAEIDAHATQSNVVPGDIRYKDQLTVDTNGDGIPDEADGIITSDDRVNIGDPIPDFLAGMNLNVGYKGIELGIDMYGSFGNKVFNAKAIESYSSEDNFTEEFLDRWTGEGTSNSMPRITYGGQNKLLSSQWVEDASFWKIQNIRLAYNLPTPLIQKIKLQSAQVYVSGNNIHYFTKYNGPSPEIPEIPNQGPLGAGVDRQVYPLVRTYRIGVNLTF